MNINDRLNISIDMERVQKFARHPELTIIATDSPRQLALLLKMAFNTLSNCRDLLSLNLSRWPKDDSYSQGKVLDNIMYEWVDSVQKHHSSVKILILIFYLVVSIIYRSNDLLDTWKTVDSQRSITPSLKFPTKDENGTVSHSPTLSGSLSQIPNTTMESKMLSKCAEELGRGSSTD